MAALAACAGRDTVVPTAVVAAAPASPAAAAVRADVITEPVPGPVATTIVEPAPALPEYLPAGVHEHQVDIDGITRRWTVVVPAGAPASSLMVVLHGVGGRGADMRSAGFEPLAAGKGVVLAYPDGVGGGWNDGRPGADPLVPGAPVDDGRFLRTLIDETVARTGADARRVAVVGFSNGAVMASRLACESADRLAAMALIAGTAGQGFEQSCRPARPVAVMMAAGVSDAVVPYAGGRLANWGTKRRGYLAGVDETFGFWRAQNGCASMLTVGAESRATDCGTTNAVVRYRVTGSAHEWYRPPRLDTTNLVWDFVQRSLSAGLPPR